MGQQCDILIVGGGPAGAAAAALLAAGGVDVLLCETKTFPREKVCGEFIGTRVRPILNRLGLLERFDELAGPPIRWVAACAPHHSEPLVSPMPADLHGSFPRSLSRADLDEMLLVRAKENGAKILQPCHVSAITGDSASGFIAETSHGQISAKTVILAHGLAQRGDLNPDTPSPPLRRQYLNFKTHFAQAAIPENTIAIAGAIGIYAGLTHSNRDRASMAFVVRRDQIDQHGNQPETHLANLLAQNPAFARMLKSATRVTPWLASGPLEPGVRTLYSDGRYFIGNAAGEVHALVGEGITLAMQAAEILADTLHHFGPDKRGQAAHAYTRQWKKHFTHRYHAARIAANLMMRPRLSTLAASVLESFPQLLTATLRQTGK